MMRKDVQIGFAIGGILVAVLIVYVLAVSGGQKNANGGAQLAEGPSSVEASPAPAPAPSATAPPTDPFKNTPASVSSADKAATPADKPQPNGTDEDKWVMALSKGTVPMMSSTPVASSSAAGSSAAPAAVKSAILNAAAPSAPAPESPATTDASTAPPISSEAPASASTQPSRPAAAVPAGARTHVVQAGETITKIAEAAYGSQNFFPHILRANPNVDPKKMRPGTVLVLPPESEVKAGLVASAADKAEANPSSLMALHATATGALDPKTQYEVQPGDSLQKISTKLYGNSGKWEAIYELNKAAIGADPAKVKVKQVLKLPEPPTVK